jgi:hypothetical protein
MFKRILAFILVVIIAVIFTKVKFSKKTFESPPLPTPTSVNMPDYLISGIEPEKLILINNTAERSSFSQIIESYHCQKAINGGFYQEDGKPLGWMVINSQQIQKIKASTIFNGFIFIKDQILEISEAADDKAVYGHQTGPIIIRQGAPLHLQITNDKPARRAVMAQDNNQNTYIVVVLDAPLLAELPEKMVEIGKNEKIIWETAINLDGGSASAYSDGADKISEITAVGSVWCMIE